MLCNEPAFYFVSGVLVSPTRTLQVAGFELQRRYGRAFDKVVQTIKTEVLPILLHKKMVRSTGDRAGLLCGWGADRALLGCRTFLPPHSVTTYY